MSLEQAVVQLEQTNAALQEEVVRFRDAAMGLNAIYPTITEGRQNTADGKYFSVPGNGAYMRLYRRNGSQAQLIADYPSRESVVEAINEATTDAEARANAAADRAEVYADNKEFVTRERLRKQATLDLDFASGDYALDDGDKVRTTNATDLLTVERATPKWVEGPNGKLREVPPNTIARAWRNGVPQGVLIEESRTNLSTWSETDGTNWPVGNSANSWASTPTEMGGVVLDRYVRGDLSMTDVASSATAASWSVFFFDGGEDTNSNVVLRGEIRGDTVTARFIRFDYTTKTFSLNISTGSEALDVDDLGGGLYHIKMTINDPSLTGVTSLRTAIYGDNKWLGGFQLEEGSTPSSYIPTTDSPVTRASDNVHRVLEDEFNPRVGVFYIEDKMKRGVGNYWFFDSGQNWLHLRSAVGGAVWYTNGGNFTANSNLPDYYLGTEKTVRWAVGYDIPNNTLTIAQDGVIVLERSGVLGEPPTSPTLFLKKWPGGDQWGVGETAKFEYIPYALTEQELIELTS